MSSEKGLICAYLLDGQGGGRRLDWDAIDRWRPDQGVLWIHLDRCDFEARLWLKDESGLNPVIVSALLAKGSRPRTTLVDDGLLVFLRGVNLNAGEDPVHTVSMRMFVDAGRVVSVRRQQLMAVEDIQRALEEGSGPVGAGDFLIAMADSLTERMRPKLTELRNELELLEEDMERSQYARTKPRLAGIQRETITLRRYLAPQRDALNHLRTAEVDWFGAGERLRLHEIIDKVTRYVENLDAGQEQAEVLHDQVSDALSERMNRNMYLLSLMAGIFLPLDFLTGLLGVNVGGIPGAENPLGFLELAAGLVLLAALLLFLFQRLQWLRPIQELRN